MSGFKPIYGGRKIWTAYGWRLRVFVFVSKKIRNEYFDEKIFTTEPRRKPGRNEDPLPTAPLRGCFATPFSKKTKMEEEAETKIAEESMAR